MSETETQDEQTQSQTSTTEESSPSTEPPASAATEPFRFAADDDSIPEWMRGKTPQEVARMTNNLVNAYNTGGNESSSNPEPRRQEPPVQNDTSHLRPPSADLLYDNADEYHRQLAAYMDARVNQNLQTFAAPFMQSQAELSKNASRTDPAYADVWKRWEPEIEAELAGIPPQQRNKALYDKAASIVRGNHWQELARDEASKLAAAPATGSERGNDPAGTPTGGPPSDALDDAWDSGHAFFENAKAMGMSKPQIRRHCEATGTSVKEYVANAMSGNVIQTKTGLQRDHA